MNKLGGHYLHPITFISNSYKNSDFKDIGFWENEKATWGEIVIDFDHTSYPIFNSNTQCNKHKHNSKIFISKDGLICHDLTDNIKSDEEALVILSHHINSFLGLLNLGGLFYFPVSEKEITHIKREGNQIEQISGGGDEYSESTLNRAMQRYTIPINPMTEWIEFPWVSLKIRKVEELRNAYDLGKHITNHTNFKKDSQIIALEAYMNYTLHKWINALLLGWTFIEILIDECWKKEVIKAIEVDEFGRKGRLKDNRTYTAAIKIEYLFSKSIFDKKLYNNLNKLRKVRNDFIHAGNFIMESDANMIFESINEIIELLTEANPLFKDPGWSRSGGWKEN